MRSFVSDRLHWSKLMVVVFHMALLSTFFDDSMLWVARAGWMLIGIIAARDIRLAYYAGFFYAAFFIPSGFAENLFFTLKHFHIMVMIIFFVQIIQNNQKANLRILSFILQLFFPLGFVFVFGVFHVWRKPMEADALLFGANILTACALSVIVALFFTKSLEDNPDSKHLQVAINYFSWGVACCVVIGLCNSYCGTTYLENISLFHNNHLGFFCNLAFFYALVLLGLENNIKKKVLNYILMTILFLGIVGSCSRTTWISFFIALTFFMVKIYQLKIKKRADCFWLHKKGFLLFCVVATVIICFLSDNVWERFYNLPQLLDVSYWHYTLNDHQNFGFLGVYRLRDLDFFLESIKSHFILGVGFSREVRDIHGLHFVILAGSGIMGYLFFLLFSLRYFMRLQKIISYSSDQILIYIAVACQATWLVWFFTSIMETFLLQFALWINVVISTVVICLSERKSFEKTKV